MGANNMFDSRRMWSIQTKQFSIPRNEELDLFEWPNTDAKFPPSRFCIHKSVHERKHLKICLWDANKWRKEDNNNSDTDDEDETREK